TGPLAVSSANTSGTAAALDVYDAEEQLGESVAVYLDGGEASGGQPSTIVDLTSDTPRVMRIGAISLEQLRAVVPGVTSDTEEQPSPEAASDSEEQPADEKPTDEAVEASNQDGEKKTDSDVRPAD
ncbi:MAG: threonylcarbamoyl-AMP synthase, partial [Kribbellaceae bacterium]|nr:threonylcarbamoyl-AMP synthase [Kribbellaceae bacterium]